MVEGCDVSTCDVCDLRYVNKDECVKHRYDVTLANHDDANRIVEAIRLHDEQAKKILDSQLTMSDNFGKMQGFQLETAKQVASIATNQAIGLNTQQQLATVSKQNSEIIKWMQGIITTSNKRSADLLLRLVVVLTAISTGLLYLHQSGAI